MTTTVPPPELPIVDDRQLAPIHITDAEMLYQLAVGQRPVGKDDAYLYPLSHTSGQVASISRAWGVSPDFLEALAWLSENPDEFKIVGGDHRSAAQKQVMKKKRVGALILLMREPGNPHDPNAVMALASSADARGGFRWYHVGYLPKEVAKRLAPHWFETNNIPVIMQATLAATETAFKSPRLAFANEYTSDVKYRDIDSLFSSFI